MDTVIVSTSPAVGLGLLHLIEDRVGGLTASRMDLEELLSTPQAFCPDLLVLAPEGWSDMALWLPHLQVRFSACPWLLFAEPRVGGLFLSHLEALRSVFVPTTASPALLRAAIRTLTGESGASLSSPCLQLFATLLGARPSGGAPPTVGEIQCACAVSLGLSDREAAALLRQRVAAFRRHVRRLMLLMGVSAREELAQVVLQALSPASVVTACRKLYDPGTGRTRHRS